MVYHIVMWKISDDVDKEKTANTIKEKLEALNGQIEAIKELTVGINFNQTDAASDIVLVSRFETREALSEYINHPQHRAVGAEFVRPNVKERRVVDYEI